MAQREEGSPLLSPCCWKPRGDASGLVLNSSVSSPVCLEMPSLTVPGTRPSQSEEEGEAPHG